jgi:hypothetical protein
MEANALAGPDVIQVPAGTYVLTLPPVDGFDDSAAGGDLDITGDLTLTGAGAGSTIIDGNDAYRVFHTRATVSVSGVTVTGGFVDGSNGGGIVNSGALTLTDCLVTGNSAQQFYSSGGSAGGIYNDGYYKNASLTVVNSTISNNAGIGSVPVGGGIWSRKEGDVTVTLTVINSSITGNSANRGGGIAAGGTTVIQNSVIANNSGHVGGGVDISGDATIAYSTISGNYSRCVYYNGDAGGIYIGSGTVAITHSTISGNGACYNGEGSGNKAAGINNEGTLTLANSTVSGNYSSNSQAFTGGIQNLGPALEIVNSTISNNRGVVGGLRRINGTVTIANTIVAGQASGPDCSGTITSGGHNLDSDGTCALGAAGDISTGNANLGPLANNGGKTLTHALLGGSQAINAGDNAVCAAPPVDGVDQRGFSRSDGACDIGALEDMPLYQLTLSVNPAEGGSISCSSNPIGHGLISTCTITVNPGYALLAVTGTCVGSLSGNTFTIGPVTANCSSTAEIRYITSALHLTSNQFFTSELGNLGQYGWGGSDSYPLVWDYDGDGINEVSVYHIPTNQWFVKGYPGDSLGQFGFGQGESIPVPGDYNGDGVMERAFYHWPTNRWFIEGVADPISFGWGGSDCLPFAGDYDGDGVTDMMLYHLPSNQWFAYGIGELGQFGWGGAHCLPVPGDWNGDGRMEIAVYYAPDSEWIWRDGNGDAHFLGQYGWGGAESFPIPGDFDGDAVAERAFYRPGENRWMIEGHPEFVWGWGGDIFMPLTDQIAVFNWYRFRLGMFQ